MMNTNTNRGNQIFIQKNCLYLGYNRYFIEEEKIEVAAKRLFTVIFSAEERLRRFHKFYVFDTCNGRRRVHTWTLRGQSCSQLIFILPERLIYFFISSLTRNQRVDSALWWNYRGCWMASWSVMALMTGIQMSTVL